MSESHSSEDQSRATSVDDTERSPISDITCPACGSDVFELKAVDEWGNGDLSIYCYCADCGNATGKMWDRTVDNRITESGVSQ